MQAEIISIGTELLLGRTVNTNAAYISGKLASLGIDLFYQTTVGDNHERLLAVLKNALQRSDIILTTGGLGPTVDDITLEVAARATQQRCVLNSSVLKEIKEHFKKRRIPMPEENTRQALIPEKTDKILKNDTGTAPGLIIPFGKKALIVLPGPPSEMQPMVERDVIPYLKARFAGKWVMISRTIRTTGLAESQVNQKVKDLLKLKPPVTVGIYAHTDTIDLNITAKSKTRRQAEILIKAVEKKIRSRLKEHIYGTDAQTMEEIVAESLNKKKKTIAVAESCTGGMISRRLTNISGSSKYFPLGIVAYSNQAKQVLLGVSAETLKKFGAVSKQTAISMAGNIRTLAKTDLGLGVTGIAGPKGATKEKPVGLIYIALGDLRKTVCGEFHFHGGRDAVRRRASQAALNMVRRYLGNS